MFQEPCVLAMNDCLKRNMKPLYITEAQVSFDETQKTQNVIIISPEFLLVYDDTGKKIVELYSWVKLRAAKLLEDQVLQIKFKNNKIQIESNNFDNVIYFISDQIQKYCSKSEQYSMNFHPETYITSFPTRFSILNRFKYHIKISKISLDSKVFQYFANFLDKNSETLDFIKFPKLDKYISSLCYCIPMISHLYTIIIDSKLPKNIIQHIAGVFMQYTSIKSIQIRGELTSEILNLLKSINQKYQPQFANLTFIDSNMIVSNLNILEELSNSTSLTSFGFNNALHSGSYRFFSTSLFQPSILNSLRSLNISNMKGINFEQLFPKLKFIESLALENVDLELTDLFDYAEKYLGSIKYLNVSRNKCSKQFSEQKLPNSLTTVISDFIKFNDLCLSSYFSFLMENCNSFLNLSITNITATEEDWQKLYIALQNQSYTKLKSLKWDFNSVDSKFFNFLKNNKNLTEISLNNCFKENNQQSISCFVDFLKNISLNSVSLCNNIYLGKNFNSILQSLNKINIETLLILNCSGIDENILLNFVENSKSLKRIEFDGINPKDQTVYLKIIDTLLTKNIDFIYPNSDISKFKEKNPIETEIKLKYMQISKEYIKPVSLTSFPLYFDKKKPETKQKEMKSRNLSFSFSSDKDQEILMKTNEEVIQTEIPEEPSTPKKRRLAQLLRDAKKNRKTKKDKKYENSEDFFISRVDSQIEGRLQKKTKDVQSREIKPVVDHSFVKEHSWEFPSEKFELNFDEKIWDEFENETSVIELYKELSLEKNTVPPRAGNLPKTPKKISPF
ncbi:hypothetical protein TVAG_090510 [Trichomonas vaginalis G3]|uniref:Leucine Rich Repeat family protein n=1 Tax=Trichomonas vaginalis (strain ATCC PRA-98 / G3) TaxID=412133 RepID=A2FA08_TRIV3|nr:leucine-rich repeat, isoform f-related family [Trichomonas vaginalis G3]EAX98275.1 hypothetical protein TVAG_090510 [Trichomonas vaginalis G3]KAI5511201.1 leucine-rich repeat, isoform f-related family [Trichomonas vaginalis G3]|eukprot:XP_001311205.1 hypothetical protein [Trichomonas vaginalis G3]